MLSDKVVGMIFKQLLDHAKISPEAAHAAFTLIVNFVRDIDQKLDTIASMQSLTLDEIYKIREKHIADEQGELFAPENNQKEH